jgi:replicative DNA helicase
MATARDLVEGDWPPTSPFRGTPTGLHDLDALTGGLSPGQLWVVIGTPGVGRTAFACQLAVTAATKTDHSVAFVSDRERPGAVLANMVSALGRVPAHHLQQETLTDDERSRLDAVSQQLAATRLRVLSSHDDEWQFEQQTSRPRLDSLVGGRAVADVLVADDVDRQLDRPLVDCLQELRNWCVQTGMALLITAAEEALMVAGRAVPELRREADVLLRIARKDEFDRGSAQAGEAVLQVLANHSGPIADLVVVFQGHYRRFVEIT